MAPPVVLWWRGFAARQLVVRRGDAGQPVGADGVDEIVAGVPHPRPETAGSLELKGECNALI